MPRIWTKEEIVALLQCNDRAVIRGVCRIYAAQTQDEQRSRGTKRANGVGFNPADAPSLSRIAQMHLKGKTIYPSDLANARMRIIKYAGQLLEVANSRASEAMLRQLVTKEK